MGQATEELSASRKNTSLSLLYPLYGVIVEITPATEDMDSVLEALTDATSVALINVAVAAEARAAPLYGQYSEREREYFEQAGDDEAKRSRLEIEREDELRQAFASLSARRTSLFDPKGKEYLRLVKILRSSPMDVITYLTLEDDEASLREWIEDLLSASVK